MVETRLYLYQNIQPNKDLEHYYFKDVLEYMTLLNNYNIKNVDLDNYRFNTNVFKVKLDDYFTEDTASNLSYAVVWKQDTGTTLYFRAYHINKVDIISGYAVISVSVDLWASHIYKMSSYTLHIDRSNKALGTPIYDDIQAYDPTEHTASVDSNNADNALATPDYLVYQEARRYYLVMVVNYNAKQNITGSDTISTTCCMAVRLDNLRNLYIAGIEPGDSDEWLLDVSAVKLAQDFAGGVYGISANFSHNDANVVDAYIIRDHAVSQSGVYTNLKSISLLKNGSDLTLQVALLNQSDYSENVYVRNITPNNDYYFGKVHGGLKLNRLFTDDYITIKVRFIINASSVEVIGEQGPNQEDLTSAFQLTITNNVSQTTPLRRIAQAITQTGQTYNAVTKGFEKSGYAGAGSALVTSIASMVGGYSINSQIRASGDALQTFGGVANYVLMPIHATYFTSIDNEVQKAYLYGVTYSLVSTIDAVLQASFLSTSYSDLTYVKGRIYINDLPVDAMDLIRSKFSNGVYIVSLVSE